MNRIYQLSNNLKWYLSLIGMSYNDLANIVGCSHNAIYNIANHKYFPSAYLAARICKALDMPFEKLFYLERKK